MAFGGRGQSTARPPDGEAAVRAAEVIGAMSIATDLGTGQPLEHALRTAILAVRLGELAELSPPELVDAYYVSLLHSFGCTSDATEQTELFGDDIEPRAKFALVDGGNPEELAAFLKDVVGQGRAPEVRQAMVDHALENALDIARSTFALHCEVAQRFAGWLGFGPGVISNLAYAFERWDGNGFPGAAGGEAIGRPARVLHVARDISVFLSAGGPDRAADVIERRAGGAYEPHLAALAIDHLADLLDGLDDALIWKQAIAAEPPPQRWMTGEEIDAAFHVIGTFTDLKSYWLRGHAEGTSQLAEAAAWRLGLPEQEVIMVRRAALALDLGRVAVSNAIWEKSGPFGLTDLERVHLHPYFTERSFAHAAALASIGELAGGHHERLDGAGYHRRTQAPGLGRPARILAAADSYQAMRERRPHRAALDAADAEAELLREASEGRLCPDAVDAVLAAAGHRVATRPHELPAGLTDREHEALLALAAGKTNKEIAETLGISAKTAGHHVQHIFDKTGVRTRSAATVWAFEHHLVQSA
ncbi:MAG TPA: HD domain-containing phosphohydrolase [Solirubrobacteraceae bacterium]